MRCWRISCAPRERIRCPSFARNKWPLKINQNEYVEKKDHKQMTKYQIHGQYTLIYETICYFRKILPTSPLTLQRLNFYCNRRRKGYPDKWITLRSIHVCFNNSLRLFFLRTFEPAYNIVPTCLIQSPNSDLPNMCLYYW